MSRFAPSPLVDDRSPKRPKTSTESNMDEVPGDIVDIIPGGDVILVLHNMSAKPEKSFGVRASSHSLSQASPVFKNSITTAKQLHPTANDDSADEITITLRDDDGDAMLLLLYILHLRNDKLPARILPSLLCKIAALAHKYQCVIAAGRATVQWFDRLYASSTPWNVWEIVEAAYLLDEPMFFARFSSRWVLEQSMFGRSVPAGSSGETQKLGLFIGEAQITAQTTLRNDLDRVADTALLAFSKDRQHHIDYAPEMSPDPDENEDGKRPGTCKVDSEAACEYLGALRDAAIYPSTTWQKPSAENVKGVTIGQLVENIKAFREPEYDDADKCDFCEDVKHGFTNGLAALKEEHEKRLWGMCLDCYKAGSISQRECRFEHPKPGVQVAAPNGQANGLGIGGL